MCFWTWPAAGATPWREPEVTSIGRLPMRTPFWSHADLDAARAGAGAALPDSPWVRSLDGDWRFLGVEQPEAAPAEVRDAALAAAMAEAVERRRDELAAPEQRIDVRRRRSAEDPDDEHHQQEPERQAEQQAQPSEQRRRPEHGRHHDEGQHHQREVFR